MIDNPFTQVHNALWTMVERNPEIEKLVKVGNRIQLNKDNDYKLQIAQNDTPELLLLPMGGVGNIRCSSSTTEFIRKYTWVITSGRLAISPIYDPLSWELFRSLVDWDLEGTLMGLRWPEEATCSFVMRATAIEVTEGLQRDMEERGINGWTGIWSVDVQMRFSTADMRIPEIV